MILKLNNDDIIFPCQAKVSDGGGGRGEPDEEESRPLRAEQGLPLSAPSATHWATERSVSMRSV